MKRSAQQIINRSSLATGAGLTVKLVLGVLFLFVAGRYYGPETFGAFAIGVAVLELGVAIGGLENKKLLFKYLDRRGENQPAVHVLADSFILTLLASSLVTIVMLLIVGAQITWFGRSPITTALMLLAPMIIGQTMLDFMLAATRWKHLVRYEVWGRNIIEPALLLAVCFLAFLLGFEQTGLIIGYWAGVLGTLVFAIYGAFKCYSFSPLASFRPSFQRMLIMFNEAIVNVLANISHVLSTRIDLYLIGILLGEKMAGIFAMARQIQSPTGAVRKSFDGIIYPLVSKTIERRGAMRAGLALASVSRRIFAIETIVIIILVAFGEQILAFAGPEFPAAHGAMIILALAETVQAAFGIGDLIFTYRNPRLALQTIILAIVTGVVAGLILIPMLGIIGAAIAVLISYAARAFMRSYLLRKKFSIHVSLFYGLSVQLAAFVSIISTYIILFQFTSLNQWPASIIACILGISIFATVLKAMMFVRKDDLEIADFQTGLDQ